MYIQTLAMVFSAIWMLTSFHRIYNSADIDAALAAGPGRRQAAVPASQHALPTAHSALEHLL